MKRIFQIIMVAVMSATFSLVFSSCEDDWDGIGSGGNGSSSGSYSNKFDYIYNCIGKSASSVLAQIEEEGYTLDEENNEVYYICIYNKHSYVKCVEYTYIIAVQNNIVKFMDYSEEYDYNKADCKQLRDLYVQLLSSANKLVKPTELSGEIYYSSSEETEAYYNASDYINAIKNYSIINNCKDEYMASYVNMAGTKYIAGLYIYLESNREDDDYSYGPILDIAAGDSKWYEENASKRIKKIYNHKFKK